MIRVAYDISLLASDHIRLTCKTGLFRVYEEVLNDLQKRKDIDLTAVGLCDSNIDIDIKGLLYSESRRKETNIKYDRTYKGRFGIICFQEKLMRALFSQSSPLYKRRRDRSFIILSVKGLMKATSFFTKKDSYVEFDPEKYDLFHSPFFPLPSKRITKNLPRILTIYDLIPVKVPEFSHQSITENFKKILESIDRKNDRIICISEFTKREFCKFTNMQSDRVHVAYLGAADHFYPIDDKKKIKAVCKKYKIGDEPYFLSVAALQPRKNFSLLIKCFIKYIKENKKDKVNLVLVGAKGWNYQNIFKTAHEYLEFKERIIFTGYVHEDDLSCVYCGALAFVFPSLYEGFGLPVLEAMKCGTPIISSNATSLPEVVGEAGLLFNPHNENELYDSMNIIFHDQKLREELKISGFTQAKKFSWEKCVEETVNIYKMAV